MNELVSIIMPSYNTEKYISESIESVLNQTYTSWELIIVDDCSKDDTEKIVKTYADARIHFYKNSKNRGAAVSRNRALKVAKGKWVAFLDSDDLWAKNKLEKQIKFMKKNRYKFSYTKYAEIDENSRLLGKVIGGPKRIGREGMYNYCWPGCVTVMYDAEYIGKIKIKNIKKNNDYAMWLKIIEKTDCFLLMETLGFYRKRSGSISDDNFLKLIKWHYKLFRKNAEKGSLTAVILTTRNLIFGIAKKLIYVTKEG